MIGGPYALSGRVALITGGTKGIGLAIARAVAGAGARVAVTFGHDEAAAELALEALRGLGAQALAIRALVFDSLDMERAVNETCEKLGGLDILVNNAGTFSLKPFDRLTLQEWDATFEVDVKGVFVATQKALPHLRKSRKGRVINIASAAGLAGAVGMAHYSAAKAAVIGLTRALAREFAPYGITVNAVAPGIVETDAATRVFPRDVLENYRRHMVPLARLGSAEEVAGAVVYLASEAASYVTGQILAVDGGFTMH
jgi:3-oxoacyl-[acyl-carrier protein] reductase